MKANCVKTGIIIIMTLYGLYRKSKQKGCVHCIVHRNVYNLKNAIVPSSMYE